MTLLFTIIIFLEIIQYIVLFDVILSWLTLLGINIRPKFVKEIIDPVYSNIRKIFPTNIWPIDFTPIVVILVLFFIRWALFLVFPELQVQAHNLLK